MEEHELFEHYEVKNWEITPRLYKFLGASVIINSLIFFSFAQFNLLNAKGCDTPYFGIVCQALDSAYIVSTFLGKGTESASFAYDKTEIEDLEVVTLIDKTDVLEYPPGYFALANPEQTSGDSLNEIGVLPTVNDPNGSTSSPTLGNDLSAKTQVTPTPNPNIGNDDIPDSLIRIDGDSPSTGSKRTPSRTPTRKPVRNNPMSNDSPRTLPGGDAVAKATPKPTPSATPTPSAEDLAKQKDEFNNKFNKKPLQDFAEGVMAKVDSPKPEDKVDLKQSFTVILDGYLTEKGTFDATKTRFLKGEGNEQMVNVAKKAIEAVGDSTIFSYLQALGVDRVSITLVQDDKNITAKVVSSQPNAENAKTVSSGFRGLILLAQMNTKDDEEVQTLLKGVKFNADGKSFVINFELPKDQAHQLIDKKLQEARQKKLQPNPNESGKDSGTQGE